MLKKNYVDRKGGCGKPAKLYFHPAHKDIIQCFVTRLNLKFDVYVDTKSKADLIRRALDINPKGDILTVSLMIDTDYHSNYELFNEQLAHENFEEVRTTNSRGIANRTKRIEEVLNRSN